MRAKEFILETVSAGKVLDYVNSIHPASQKDSNLDQIILANTEYVLKTVAVDQLQIDADDDPYGRVVHIDVDYADEISPDDIKRKPIVIDAQGNILDGNHRAWQARELGITHVPAYVAVEELTESLDPEVEEFLNDLTPADVGVDEVGDYRVHFEGFTDDCQSSRAYRRNPEKVFQEVFADFIRREGGQQPVASGMVGDEDYPILYSVFKNNELTEADALNYIGNCTDDDVIEHIFGDATGFAQAVDEYGDEFVLDDLVVKYNPEEDIHYFYYKS
jgi:hypothetical protein